LADELVRELLQSQLADELENCRCEKLADEAGDRSRIQRKENIYRWKLLPSNGAEGRIIDSSVYVCVFSD
jgi:hypothetical protein